MRERHFATASPYTNEVESHNEGLTNNEIQREVQRVLDPNQNRRADGGGKGPGQPWLNVNASEHFNLLTKVRQLPAGAVGAGGGRRRGQADVP